MRTPEDVALLAIWQGRGSWSGSAVNATELASYLEEAEEQLIPRTAAALDRILRELHDAGFVELASAPLDMRRGIELFNSYVLTDAGQARAHELEALDEHFPPHSDGS